MNNKEIGILKKAKYIAQHKPWWSNLFPKTALRRSVKARLKWELYSKSLVMQAKDFTEIYYVLNLCQTNSKAKDGGIFIAADLARTIEEINIVSAKAGIGSPLQIYINLRRSEISPHD